MNPRPQKLIDARAFAPAPGETFDYARYHVAVARAWNHWVVRLRGRVTALETHQFQLPEITKPVTRHHLTISRDVEPVRYEEATKRHNPRKGSKQYHERIQKKWAKRGLTGIYRVKELVVFSVSPLQLKIIRISSSKRKKV